MSLCRAYFSAFCYFKSNNSLPANKAFTFMFLVSYISVTIITLRGSKSK